MLPARAHLQRFRQLAATLGSSPSAEEIADVAVEVAGAAVAASVPGKSIALLVRHHLQRHPPEVQAQIRRLAGDTLQSMLPERPTPPIEATWVSIDEAAVILGVPVLYLLARIHLVAWRRAWGWPRWVGPRPRDWLFARAAIDGATAAATLANLPEQEPFYPLPDWCERAA